MVEKYFLKKTLAISFLLVFALGLFTLSGSVNALYIRNKVGVTDHTKLSNLLFDDHTQYCLLAGRSNGQTIIGGTLSTEDLTLQDNTINVNQVTVSQLITAYTHSQDNTQAHSDYLLNIGDSSTGDYNFAGNLDVTGNVALGSGASVDSNVVFNLVDALGVDSDMTGIRNWITKSSNGATRSIDRKSVV